MWIIHKELHFTRVKIYAILISVYNNLCYNSKKKHKKGENFDCQNYIKFKVKLLTKLYIGLNLFHA